MGLVWSTMLQNRTERPARAGGAATATGKGTASGKGKGTTAVAPAREPPWRRRANRRGAPTRADAAPPREPPRRRRAAPPGIRWARDCLDY